jgi:hypothetical protein
MSSCAWSLLDGKVKILSELFLTLLMCLDLLLIHFFSAGLALSNLPEKVLLLAE